MYRDVAYLKVARARDQAQAKRKLKPGVLVLVVPNKQPKSLKFFCPCGCGEVVSVNLMPGKERAWTLDYDSKRGLSLWPSVWLTTGCQSHFLLRHNKMRILTGQVPRMSANELSQWWSEGHTQE
jgi:Family of unknown function (DUF6527)